MKRLLIVLLLLAAQPAHAFLPANVENVIRSWFDGSGKFQCIKVSGGGVANCLYGANMTATNGCAVTGGVMTCSVGFDSPAQAAQGSCVTLKEGSNNGTDKVHICSPPVLGTTRTWTLSDAGRLNAIDVGGVNATDLGRVTRYNSTSGALEPVDEANPMYLPYGNTLYDAVGSNVTVALGVNEMRCQTFTAPGTVIGATSFSTYVATAGGSCGLCLYPATDAGALIAPLTSGSAGAAKDCTGTGIKTHTTDAFNIYAGQNYRLCFTSDSAATRWYATPESLSLLNNITTVWAGNAAEPGVSGVCPATTGALTSASVKSVIARVGH